MIWTKENHDRITDLVMIVISWHKCPMSLTVVMYAPCLSLLTGMECNVVMKHIAIILGLLSTKPVHKNVKSYLFLPKYSIQACFPSLIHPTLFMACLLRKTCNSKISCQTFVNPTCEHPLTLPTSMHHLNCKSDSFQEINHTTDETIFYLLLGK